MALPALQKTWQGGSSLGGTEFVNKLVVGANQQRAMLLKIRDAFVGFNTWPWTVAGSSDSLVGAMDASDRWVDTGDLVYITTAGTPYSWIVLQQPGTGAQVCISLERLLALDLTRDDIVSIVSPSGSFSGGSATARPTAPDEFLGTVTGWLGDQAGVYTDKILTCIQSTDGECTRVVISDVNSEVPCAAWGFERPRLPDPDWAENFVWYFLKSTVASALSCLRWEVMQSTEPFWGRKAGVGFLAKVVAPVYTTNEVIELQETGSSPRLYGGTLVSRVVSDVGPLGGLYDWYWCSRNITGQHLLDLDTLPLAGNRTFVCVGDCVWGWLDDSATDLSFTQAISILPIFVASSTVVNPAVDATVTVPVPAGTVDGDLMVLIMTGFNASQTSPATPPGWVLDSKASMPLLSTVTYHHVFHRFASSEPASYDIAMLDPSNGLELAVCLTYRPAHATQLEVLANLATGTATAAHTLPNATTTHANSIMLSAFSLCRAGGLASSVVTPPAGATQRADINGSAEGSPDCELAIYEEVQAVAGLYAGKSITTQINTDGAGFTLGIRASLQ